MSARLKSFFILILISLHAFALCQAVSSTGAILRFDVANNRFVVPSESAWDDGKRRCILIHGIRSDINIMNLLAISLANLTGLDGKPLYDEVWGYNYEWCNGIRGNAERLAQLVNSKHIANNKHKLDVIGYSMGGLVARWAIEKAGLGVNTSRLFTIGTPHYGVPLPEWEALGKKLGCNNQGLRDLLRDSKKGEPNFQRALNDGASSVHKDRIIYFTIAGSSSEYMRVGKVGNLVFDVGDITRAAYPDEDKVQDGIVPVRSAHYIKLGDKSAKWQTRNYRRTFKLNHSELINHQEVFNAITGWLWETQLEVEAWEAQSAPLQPVVINSTKQETKEDEQPWWMNE